MSRQTKIILVGLGLLTFCGFCGLATFLFTNYFKQPDPAAANLETPVESPTVAVVVSRPTSTPLSEEIPYHAVVQITAQFEDDGDIIDGWTGSGSLISSDGLILTNAHVVLPEPDYPVDYLMVSLTGSPDENPIPMYYAEVMQADANLDLAVLRIVTDINGNQVNSSDLDLPAVRIGDSDALTLGDRLTILGYPGIGGTTITLTRGEVSGFTSQADYGSRAFIKTNATIAGGNSGGLAVNTQGELVGIPTQLGSGGDDEVVDCRVLADTNGDGAIDGYDSCIPTGGFINSLRPIKLALPFIERARKGEIAISSELAENDSIEKESEPDDVLFSDDFSNSSSGWEEFADEDGSAGYKNGRYQIDVTSANMVRWAVSQNDFADMIIGSEVKVSGATGEGDFGFLCRYIDEQNFYALEVSEDGYAAIWKLVDGVVEVLVDWQYIGEMEGSTHYISAACIGSDLTIALDGEEVAAAADSDFQSGDIGLVAGTNEVKNLTVTFDDLVVIAP